MWTGFAPRVLYAEEAVTVMELICASACLTSMICFSLEVKYGHLLSTDVHMHRHRAGARGNVTCFPLPWEDLLQELRQRPDAAQELPRTGRELADVVQVLLKTGDSAGARNLQHVVHQARVRRRVVVELILDAKRRGHRAYVHLQEHRVRARSEDMPDDGVPPEFVRTLGSDDSMEKLQPQKAATPVAGRTVPEDAFNHIRPRAVVQDR